MKLVIGGVAQGKTDYVKEQVKDRERQPLVVNHLHLLIRDALQKGEDPEKMIAAYLLQDPEVIFICDEIGNGIVPMDSFEREYREKTGRILIGLAKKAEEVERVVCGIGQKLK